MLTLEREIERSLNYLQMSAFHQMTSNAFSFSLLE